MRRTAKKQAHVFSQLTISSHSNKSWWSVKLLWILWRLESQRQFVGASSQRTAACPNVGRLKQQNWSYISWLKREKMDNLLLYQLHSDEHWWSFSLQRKVITKRLQILFYFWNWSASELSMLCAQLAAICPPAPLTSE